MTGPDLVLDEALRLAELGYRVLPCNQKKRPVLKAWPKNATTEPEQIREWFSQSNYLLAVKTGPDADLFVVDVDPSGMDWLVGHQE